MGIGVGAGIGIAVGLVAIMCVIAYMKIAVAKLQYGSTGELENLRAEIKDLREEIATLPLDLPERVRDMKSDLVTVKLKLNM